MEEEEDGGLLSEPTLEERVQEDLTRKKRKKKFVQAVIDQSDPLQPQYRHLRESERKVKDKVLIAIGNLVGEGLSLNEAAKAVVEVGNEERKRIVSLQKLKEQGGPFTSAEEVDAYLADLDDVNKKEKQKRMKLEVSYARDTSTLLPKADPLFKIRKVDVKGKQRDKTAMEFGEALAVLLGRKADRKAMDYSTFKECLTKMVA